MRSRAQEITAVLVSLRIAAAQVINEEKEWTYPECLRLRHLLAQNIPVFRKLRDVSKWASILIFTVGLFILCTTHIVKTETLTHRLAKLIILAFLTVISIFSFAAVIYVRENSLSLLPSAMQIKWDSYNAAFDYCNKTFVERGSGEYEFALPEINGVPISTEKEFKDVIVNAPTIGAFWAIAPAFIALISVWCMLFMLREWHLERSTEAMVGATGGANDLHIDAEAGSSRPDSGKHWRPASDTGADDASPDPDSVGSILNGHCAICNHSLDMFNSTELNCYHRVHDACIFKERKTVNSKKGLQCPACAKQKTQAK